MVHAQPQTRFNGEAVCRVLPFALYMGFIAIQEALGVLQQAGALLIPPAAHLYLYPVKILSVAALLVVCRDKYLELRLEDLRDLKRSAAVVLAGVVTFVVWISITWTVQVAPPPPPFAPALLPEGAVRVVMTGLRVVGAVLVVPVMEELFWRSFLLRYLIRPRFWSVRIGDFSWPSFLFTTVLFGLEHHLIVAGMAAGAIYNIICYRTRSIILCVLAHAVTNLALACYVLATGKWYLW
ncbi:CAAX prenyl protease-related protein [Geomonas azotofigens]|uniref:CAAX prenyl protease-related protein n=1 Tax=Geomonas azotofigens TaxID=2843196 RepID=UPI001C11B8E9|nr:CAAX prenyl protease-related protein [Geomonas azotofigens]MBU5613475.1 CAAX prenyl protease-related protein [Geomonas azotofigens]